MAQNAYKPFALAGELYQRFLQRNLNPTQSIDVDGFPVVSFGTGLAGGQNAVVKVISYPWPLAQDALGNVANIYTPDTMQLILEADAAGNPSVLNALTLLEVMHDTIEFGTQLQLWLSANGTPPSTATLAVSSNLKATVDSIKYPLLSTM